MSYALCNAGSSTVVPKHPESRLFYFGSAAAAATAAATAATATAAAAATAASPAAATAAAVPEVGVCSPLAT